MNYRTRSNEVRAAARAKLSALRAERVRKRSKLASSGNEEAKQAISTSGSDHEAPAVKMHGSPELVALLEPATKPKQQPKKKKKTQGKKAKSVKAKMVEEPAAGEPSATGRQSEPAAIEEPNVDAELTTLHEAETQQESCPKEKIKPDQDLAPVEKLADAYALTRLPTVGPGLVWHLQRVGIHSLDELAHADASELAKRLGSIAELMKLAEWIDLAKRAAPEGMSQMKVV
ncbi:MAG: hypothetical protein AAFR27_15370 [Pseudomonadota bacterium]